MLIFISWSGDRSKYIAETFYSWLPDVIQSVKPFMSSHIAKGDRGITRIADNLEKTAVGLVCLTPENKNSPWIQFESGAIAKAKNASLMCFLFALSRRELEPPLSDFQNTLNTESEIRAMVVSINDLLGDNRLSKDVLEKSFRRLYPELEDALKKTPTLQAPATIQPRKITVEEELSTYSIASKFARLIWERFDTRFSESDVLDFVGLDQALVHGFVEESFEGNQRVLRLTKAGIQQADLFL